MEEQKNVGGVSSQSEYPFRGEEIEALVNKGTSFYEACCRSLRGDSFRALQQARAELADLASLFRLLGDALPKGSKERQSGEAGAGLSAFDRMDRLFTGGDRWGVRIPLFVRSGSYGCLGGSVAAEDWRCLVFNFLVARGIPMNEARSLVQEMDGYRHKKG